MTDPPRYPDALSDSGADPDRGTPPGMPRWVKVSGLIVGVVVLALIAIMIIGGGDHGPSRHATGDQPTERSEHKPPAGEAPSPRDPSELGRG